MGKLNNNQSIYIIDDDLTKYSNTNGPNNHMSTKCSHATNNLFNLIIYRTNTSIIDQNLTEVDLLYRAEGNANLVISLPDTRKVLRLRKSYTVDYQLLKG